ncbi:protease complex subunit PrcB family protein [Anaerolentibacter hominis]|uniref:protease complex subunit PrcB family protein n=1 Tax=Anaerolentibacter hominis TaxID=3079009 RepID=UPI0031B86E1B
MKRILIVLLLAASFSVFLGGCSLTKDKAEKKGDPIPFTVVEDAKLPDELKELIEGKKAEPFEMTYNSDNYLYIVVGFGKKDTGGYSITVDNVYLDGEEIHIETSLLGPEDGSMAEGGETFPFVTVKMEYRENMVVFD